MPKEKPPEPEISEEAKKALQAGWDRAVAAGDVGLEKPEEAGKKPEKKVEKAESKEKKDFFDKVLSFTRSIGEKWQNFRNREVPLENLQQRYGATLTPEEQAADEALMKKAEAEKAALEQKFAAMTAEEHGEAALDESLKRGELELEEETLSKEYEQLAQEVAKEGEEESDLYKKVLEGKAEMPPPSEAGAKLNETYRRLMEVRLEREKLDREAAARKAYEVTAKKAEKAAPAAEEAPAAVPQAKPEEKPVESPKEAEKKEDEPTTETSEEALTRMEAAHEKLMFRETELEGMVELADDVASGKLKKTDLSAAQMLWLEKAGEVESAREELANTREARGLLKKQIEARKPPTVPETVPEVPAAAPEIAVAAAATAAGAEIAEAELKASEERESSRLLDSVGKKIGQGLQRAAADLAKVGMTEKQLGAATEKDDRFIGQLLKSGLISPDEAVAMQSLKGKLDKLRNDFRAEVKKAIKEGRKRGRKRPAAKAPLEASL